MTCPEISSFDIGTTAGFYSAVAGVMSGFAFVSLSTLIATDGFRNEGGDYDSAAQALGSAFISLLLISVTYAILAGDTESSGRASTVEVIAGAGLSAAALQLIYSITLLIRLHRTDSPLHAWFQTIGGVFLCPLGYLLVLLGVNDYMLTSADNMALLMTLGWIGFSLVSAGAVFAWIKARKVDQLPQWLNPSLWAVVLTAGAIVISSILDSLLTQCQSANPIVIAVTLIAVAAVAINQSLWFQITPSGN